MSLKRKPERDPSIAWPTAERQRMGGFTEARTYEFEPDNDGKPNRRAIRTIRASDATAASRLAKYATLTPAQIMAATMFERDYETASLEPKMTANLIGAGGAANSDLPEMVHDARDRVHYAREALRLAGPNVVRVIEAMVLNAGTLSAAGQDRSPHKKVGLAWATLALEAGLHLLEAHYRARGRLTN